MIRRSLCAISALIVLLTSSLLFAQEGQSQSTPTQLFDAGMQAARRGDYATAISYFDHVRRTDPGDVDAIFNLALADSKVQGGEFPALAWFEAYLDANPAAPNRRQVRQEIAALRGRLHAMLTKVTGSALQMAQQYTTPEDRTLATKYVAMMYGYASNQEDARRTADLLDPETRDLALKIIGSVQFDTMHGHCDTYLRQEDPAPPEISPPGEWNQEFRTQRLKAWAQMIDRNLTGHTTFDLPDYLRVLERRSAQQMFEGMFDLVGNFWRALQDIQDMLMQEGIRSFDAAEAYAKQGDSAHALQYYDRAVQLCPNYRTLWGGGGDLFSNRAWDEAHKGQYDWAMQDFSQCIRRNDKCDSMIEGRCVARSDALCLFARGALHFIQGEYEAASADFNRSTGAGPETLIWRYFARFRLGERPDAKAWFGPFENAYGRDNVSLFGVFMGKATPEQYGAAFENDDWLGGCSTFFYLAENAWNQGRREEAERYFLQELEKTAQCGNNLSYLASRAELKRLLSTTPGTPSEAQPRAAPRP